MQCFEVFVLASFTGVVAGSASLASQKAAMGILTPINVGQARMPIPNLTDDVIERMRTALSTYRS